ncbi:hypothetical protein C5S35_07670 [Candidatus Methanophagaceae archaeon]|nr:hypothetical protein C5S35_07670 [Methanophagales archaeon]
MDYFDSFWQAGAALATFSVNPARPAVENAILERLGDAPFSVGRTNLNSLLSKAYETASRTALQTAAGDSDEE